MHARGNWDNGELLSTLLDFAAPDLPSVCERSREENDYDRFVDCFNEAHPTLLSLAKFMPIRVFRPLRGSWGGGGGRGGGWGGRPPPATGCTPRGLQAPATESTHEL